MTRPKTTEPHRSPTAFEGDVLRKILTGDEALVRFAAQVSGATVARIDDYGSISIEPAGCRSEVVSSPMRKLPAEAQVKDADGVDVHFLLFEREGWLWELQVYKDDGSPIRRPISIDDLEVVVLR